MASGAVVSCIVALSLSGHPDGEPELHRYEAAQVQMGTTFRIVFYASNDRIASMASEAAFNRIEQLDATLSDYRDDSELTLLSQSAGGPPVAVSPLLFDVMQQSVEFSKASDGAFDITIGPVVRLWRRARRNRELPNPQQIQEYLQRTGYQKIELDPKARTVKLSHDKMRLDLGGIAKGLACDEALKALAKNGVDRGMVDGGGDISVSNPPPNSKGWKISVQPLDDQSETLLLSNASIATSGDTNQFVEIDGKRYSHIVDPKTGIGLTNRIQVTVMAPDGATADALASAISVLGAERGLELAKSFPRVAARISQVELDQIKTYTSKGWPNASD